MGGTDAKGGAVEAPRRVDGRTARARATRARILDAAINLFTGKGYTSTSVESIAAWAGVGVQTVYYAFGSKRAILEAALVHVRIGDDETRLVDQPWVRDVLDCPDPQRQLRLLVEGFGRTYAKAAGLLEVVRNAAATDPELASTYREDLDQQRDLHVHVLQAMARTAPLRTGLDPDEAADIMLATLAPGSYIMLVTIRGWSQERWRDWVWNALVHQVTGTSLALTDADPRTASSG